jgi:LysR family glycine cleavage system transcriptional activator
MRQGLPSLNALRVFEAVGQYQSVSDAARALHVSPGAVSRFVSLLESELGGSLFERGPRGMQLTREGQILLESVRASFTTLRHASEGVRNRFINKRDLVIWSYPTFAIEWLVPRLGHFKRAHSHVDLKLQTSLTVPQDVLGRSTVALLRREECGPELVYADLFKEQLIPVCKPGLIPGRLPAPASAVATLPLISTESRHPAWLKWIFQYAGTRAAPRNVMFFDRSAHAIRAAIEGHGIALSAHIWVAEAIERGSLVAPFGNRWVQGDAIVLATMHQIESGTDVGALCDWLIEEVRKSESLWSGLTG